MKVMVWFRIEGGPILQYLDPATAAALFAQDRIEIQTRNTEVTEFAVIERKVRLHTDGYVVYYLSLKVAQ